MNAALYASSPSARPSAALVSAIARACHKIAPLWPLKHFVAVNPFLGFSGESFAATCETLRRVAQVNALMPRVKCRSREPTGPCFLFLLFHRRPGCGVHAPAGPPAHQR